MFIESDFADNSETRHYRMQRHLSRAEIRALADLLVDTDDDLDIGISQLGYEPDSIVKPPLARIGRVRQCRECGFWFRVTNKGHHCGPDNTSDR